MGALAAPFPVLPGHGQQPVHGGDRAQVDAVIEQAGPHLRGGQVAVLRRAQHRQDVLALGLGQPFGGAGRGVGGPGHRRSTPPIAGCPRRTQQRARLLGRRDPFEVVEVFVDHGFDFGSASALSESSSKSACTEV